MIADLTAGTFFVALIYVLVRPGSKGTAAVQAFGDMLSTLIGTVTEIARDTGDEESAEFDGETADGNIDITED